METNGVAMTERSQGPRVVIIGGGFGGLHAAKALANEAVEVTLIDRKNHHIFQPLLYQVALGVLSPGEITASLRHILRKSRNVHTILGEVTEFDTAARRVKLIDGAEIAYDYLIIAAGARHAYFGHDEWEKDAPGLKTIEDAVEIRSRLLRAFETAERRAHLTGRQEPLSFAVIGGGPTGVELAGAIADLARLALARDFKAIDTTKARVQLYEASPRILGTYSEESSRKAKEQLEQLGVEVYTDSMVTAVEDGRIKVRDQWIETDVTLWGTGVCPSPLGKKLGVTTDRAGRVLIEQDLSVPGHREIFVIGDMSALTDASSTRSGSRRGRITGGQSCRREYPARLARQCPPFVHLSGSGYSSDHRTSPRGGSIRTQDIFGLDRMASLVIGPHFSADRFSQPSLCDDSVGMGVFDTPRKQPSHY